MNCESRKQETETTSLVFLLLFANIVLLDLVPEDAFADPKALRGLGLNPLVILEGLKDEVFFDRLKGFRQPFLFSRDFRLGFGPALPKMKGKIPRCDDLSPAKDHRSLDHVLEFSHVSWIRIPQKNGPRLFGDVQRRFLICLR